MPCLNNVSISLRPLSRSCFLKVNLCSIINCFNKYLIKLNKKSPALRQDHNYLSLLDYFLSTCSSETVSLCLPFFLLLAKTLRPFAVSIRLRKPCTLLRRRLCGWYVLFLPGIVLSFFLYKLIIIVSATGHHS